MRKTALLNCTNNLPSADSRNPERSAGQEGWSDLSLVQRCARHDPAAMREIVEQYQQKLYRFLNGILGSHEDTEEAVFDVFLRVWQQAERFEGRSGVATWLYRIAANVAYDRLRRRKVQDKSAFAPADWPVGAAVNAEEAAINRLESADLSRQLHEALQTLRVEDRMLLILYYTEELEYEEIVRITRCPYPVLKVRLMRARKRLRAALESLAAEAQKGSVSE